MMKTMCINVQYNTQKAIKRHHNKDMKKKREMHVVQVPALSVY
jgi:hypothetical protein